MKITSVNNSLIEEILSLKETKMQKEKQSYIIEGIKMVNLALEKQVVETILVEKNLFEKYKHFLNVIEISDNVSKKLSDLKTNQGIFAVCKMQQKEDLDGNYLILDGIQDPGNLGTLIRSAFAFEFKNVICSNNCVSFYNPKVLRATQSNHFDLNLRNEDLSFFLDKLKQKNIIVVGTLLKEESNSLEKIKVNRIALILGNEGQGISKEISKKIDLNIKIKTNPDLESLNVAIAGSILMKDIYSMN
ncbi:TrmH family RNA methyltransferase [Spiroplasma diminutum]|uniref:RNA methyltransferase, TrmH family n=1 Tax=Spiroplasma diminutum CUAS-1 TaxID=1276221 RepID=S5MEZ2_9MOLU|nr:RNA methyltransferase [Spiroplasma diminutum]AGR42348.1 RNA methyltransferase, TrmH family [Spiroplasma diminutum CUAS-1]